MILSKEHLAMVYELVAREAGVDPSRPWQDVLAALEGRPAGELVFRLVLPIEPVAVRRGRKTVLVELAPTLNEYASMPGWKRALARKAVDDRVVAERFRWPAWSSGCVDRMVISAFTKVVKGKKHEVVGPRPVREGGRRRAIVVTRRSSRRVDEVSTDAAGSKIATDRLVIAGVLTGDSAKWLDRSARWEPVPPGQGEVVVEVFELAPPPAA